MGFIELNQEHTINGGLSPSKALQYALDEGLIVSEILRNGIFIKIEKKLPNIVADT